MDGAGSTWAIGSDLYVGRYGSGTLNIAGAGTVTNYGGRIGWESGSVGDVAVDGAGSTWTNEDVLYIGLYGSGTLKITNGGAVSNSSYAGIGYQSGSTGDVTVDGASVYQENFANGDVANPVLPSDPPEGVRLSTLTHLGFRSSYPDAAYNLGLDPNHPVLAALRRSPKRFDLKEVLLPAGGPAHQQVK